MATATRNDQIQRYKDGYAAIVEALTDITPEELDAREAPGEWSPREIVHHLADSEMTSAIRLRLFACAPMPLPGQAPRGGCKRSLRCATG